MIFAAFSTTVYIDQTSDHIHEFVMGKLNKKCPVKLASNGIVFFVFLGGQEREILKEINKESGMEYNV